MTTMMKPIPIDVDDPVTEAKVAQSRADVELREAETELTAVLAAQDASDLLDRPGALELAQARQRVTNARRAHRAAVEVLAATRAAQQREAAEAQRRQRRAALTKYIETLEAAAALWPAVVAAGPIVGLSPAVAFPEGVADFRTWTERHVP